MSSRTRVIHSQSFAVDSANVIAEAAEVASRERGTFRLALSGGNTPRLVYQELRKLDLPWDKFLITFSDERCVPPDDEQSNYRMAHESLLGAVPIPKENVLRMRGEETPEVAAAEYESQLSALARAAGEPRFAHDVLLLGIGGDGHTASLFPGTTALGEHEHDVIANYVPQFSTHRLTFTYPLINAARHVLFLVNDASKLPVLEKIWAGDGSFPATGVRPVSGELTWLLGF